MSNPQGANTAETPGLALSDLEKDALGEIGNICMGTSATTLSTLLGKEVTITTPKVSIHESPKTIGRYEKPFFVVEVSYTEGVDGYNVLLMKEDDVKVITNLLLGGDGNPDPDTEVDELHFSAISEVMNQMVGSAATSLSNIIMRSVNISPPTVNRILLDDDNSSTLIWGDDPIVKISFDMEIEGVLKSELMQVMPFVFGKDLAAVLVGDMLSSPEEQPAPPPPPPPPAQTPPPRPQSERQPAAHRAPPPPAQPVSVKSVQYESFDDQLTAGYGDYGENMGLIMDVPLQVTVELGKSRKSIKEILSLNMGSVIVLDKQAGEMVDVLVNGKLYARGEVVVIDDNFGVRVTEIVSG